VVFSLPGDSVFRHHGVVSRILRIGLRWAGGGLAAVVLGLAASGGFGPCGPQHEVPFVIAITGSACFLAGLVILLAGFAQIGIQKLRNSSSDLS
jgi:hypothetical protein